MQTLSWYSTVQGERQANVLDTRTAWHSGLPDIPGSGCQRVCSGIARKGRLSFSFWTHDWRSRSHHTYTMPGMPGMPAFPSLAHLAICPSWLMHLICLSPDPWLLYNIVATSWVHSVSGWPHSPVFVWLILLPCSPCSFVAILVDWPSASLFVRYIKVTNTLLTELVLRRRQLGHLLSKKVKVGKKVQVVDVYVYANFWPVRLWFGCVRACQLIFRHSQVIWIYKHYYYLYTCKLNAYFR